MPSFLTYQSLLNIQCIYLGEHNDFRLCRQLRLNAVLPFELPFGSASLATSLLELSRADLTNLINGVFQVTTGSRKERMGICVTKARQLSVPRVDHFKDGRQFCRMSETGVDKKMLRP